MLLGKVELSNKLLLGSNKLGTKLLKGKELKVKLLLLSANGMESKLLLDNKNAGTLLLLLNAAKDVLSNEEGNIELSNKLLGSALNKERLAIKLLEEARTGKEKANELEGTELTRRTLEETSKGKVAAKELEDKGKLIEAAKELEDKGKLIEAAKLLKAAELAKGKAELDKALSIGTMLETKGQEIKGKEAKLEAESKLLKDNARELVLKAALVKALLLKTLDEGSKEEGKLLQSTALLNNRLPKLVKGRPKELLNSAALKGKELNPLEERLKKHCLYFPMATEKIDYYCLKVRLKKKISPEYYWIEQEVCSLKRYSLNSEVIKH